MNNLFIFSNRINHSKIKVKDLRKKANNSFIKFINKPIDSKEKFFEFMSQYDYNEISSGTLSKIIDEYEINLNVSNNSIESLICYNNNDTVKIPENIFNVIMGEINSYK